MGALAAIPHRTTSELEERALPHFWTGKQVEELLLFAVREKIRLKESLAVVGDPPRGHVCVHTIIGLTSVHLAPQEFRLVQTVLCRRVTGAGPTIQESAPRFGYTSRRGLTDEFDRLLVKLARRITELD